MLLSRFDLTFHYLGRWLPNYRLGPPPPGRRLCGRSNITIILQGGLGSRSVNFADAIEGAHPNQNQNQNQNQSRLFLAARDIMVSGILREARVIPRESGPGRAQGTAEG